MVVYQIATCVHAPVTSRTISMRIIDLIHQLLPAGTDAAFLTETPSPDLLNRPGGATATFPNYSLCPIWPPDLFAVVGTIIDRSGCYTEASPDRNNLSDHEEYIYDVSLYGEMWNQMLYLPNEVQGYWHSLVSNFGMLPIAEISSNKAAANVLLRLFAIADEASVGMGWDAGTGRREFANNVLINAVNDPSVTNHFKLPYWPYSLCGMVSPNQVIVLPKSLTTTKGCTIRSLSHHLALLPCVTTLEPSWYLVSPQTPPGPPNEMRLLMVPFPYIIPPESFQLSYSKRPLWNDTSISAYFTLQQRWLNESTSTVFEGQRIADELVLPLIANARNASDGLVPTGVVFPECALSPLVADALAASIASSGIEFLIVGVLEQNPKSLKWMNKARNYAFVDGNAIVREQSKQHRWRLDRKQTNAYGLDFDRNPENDQWWEDIDVSRRTLPFYAVRKDMSMVTLICEDLARMDPAMNAIRAIGPNLVVALLMDGPQLADRWPARYAGVLADEPGCAVLSMTCAAMVDSSNRHYGSVARVIGRWTSAGGKGNDLHLGCGDHGVLLYLTHSEKHQTTLDNRSDAAAARELNYTKQVSLRVEGKAGEAFFVAAERGAG